MIIEMTVEQMKEIVENYRLITEDITFAFGERSLTIKSVDPSHVCMLTSTHPANNFVQYEIDVQYEVEDAISLTFELSTLKQLLVGSKKTNVVMEWDGQGPVSFVINGMTRKVLPFDNRHPPSLPVLDYSVELTLNTIWFENAMKHARDVATLVRLEVIQSRRDEYSSPDFQLKVSAKDANDNGLEMFHDIEGVDNYPHQTYSVDKLKVLSKRIRMSLGKGDSNTLTLSFGTGHPIQLDFSSAFGDYIYFLAPRMDGDDY